MNEAEEFEFRLRMEQEAAAPPPAATDPPSALSVAGNAAWKGLAGVADFPLNIAGAVGNALIPPAVRPGAMKNPVHTAMTAAGLIRPENEPQTPGQRILDLAVQSGVGTAINPTSTVAGLAKNAAMGALSGTTAGITKEATGSDAAALAVGVATPLVAHAIAGGLSKANEAIRSNPTLQKTMQQGQEAGFVVPPSQVKPSFATNRLESIAGKAATRQQANVQNIATANRLAAEEIGLPTSMPLTEDAVLAVRDEANKVYQQVADISPRAEVALARLRETRLDAGDNWVEYARSRRMEARHAAEAADAKALLYERVIEREARANGQAGIIGELRDARTTIAKTHDIQNAMNVGDGNVSPTYFGAKLQRGKPLSGNLEIIGRFAKAFPSVMRDAASVPAPGVSGTEAGMSAMLGAVGYGAAGGPAGLVAAGLPLLRSPARAMLLSKGYQNRLLAQPPALDQAMLQSILAGRALADSR